MNQVLKRRLVFEYRKLKSALIVMERKASDEKMDAILAHDRYDIARCDAVVDTLGECERILHRTLGALFKEEGIFD